MGMIVNTDNRRALVSLMEFARYTHFAICKVWVACWEAQARGSGEARLAVAQNDAGRCQSGWD